MGGMALILLLLALPFLPGVGRYPIDLATSVLIYVLLADRAVEILADRGIQAQVGNQKWEGICAQMRAHFGAGNFEGGSVEGIRAISDLLAQHFPAARGNANELSDRPVVL